MMAKYNIEISEPAESDLRDIVRYIYAKLDAPITALKMMDIIEKAIASLVDIPYRFPLVNDELLANKGYHKLIVTNYIVFYTIDEDKNIVDVERILFVKRNWRRIL
jgi:plasmid stabilization system protein ParE